mmetsp:Transcript_17023/g.34545  ORF Transcript_17023/g.34545 Transcript_17023/m.34545 type:complete len:156 (-) Transcript_17023:536-1003(-)
MTGARDNVRPSLVHQRKRLKSSHPLPKRVQTDRSRHRKKIETRRESFFVIKLSPEPAFESIQGKDRLRALYLFILRLQGFIAFLRGPATKEERMREIKSNERGQRESPIIQRKVIPFHRPCPLLVHLSHHSRLSVALHLLKRMRQRQRLRERGST